MFHYTLIKGGKGQKEKIGKVGRYSIQNSPCFGGGVDHWPINHKRFTEFLEEKPARKTTLSVGGAKSLPMTWNMCMLLMIRKKEGISLDSFSSKLFSLDSILVLTAGAVAFALVSHCFYCVPAVNPPLCSPSHPPFQHPPNRVD